MLLGTAAAQGSRGVLPSVAAAPGPGTDSDSVWVQCLFSWSSLQPRVTKRLCSKGDAVIYLSILFHDGVEAVLGVALALVVTSDKRRAEDSQRKAQNSAEAYGVLQDIFNLFVM